jgi:hypothetical protein
VGAINFGRLTNKNNLALVNEPESQEEQEEQYFFNYELEEVEEELKNHEFYYFNLAIEFGYYEGFYLKLKEDNTKLIYENTQEKKEVLKELTKIKNILIQFVNDGLLWGCHPSWLYNRLDTSQTLKEIKELIKQLKEEVKSSYTERTAKIKNISILDLIRG